MGQLNTFLILITLVVMTTTTTSTMVESPLPGSHEDTVNTRHVDAPTMTGCGGHRSTSCPKGTTCARRCKSKCVKTDTTSHDEFKPSAGQTENCSDTSPWPNPPCGKDLICYPYGAKTGVCYKRCYLDDDCKDEKNGNTYCSWKPRNSATSTVYANTYGICYSTVGYTN